MNNDYDKYGLKEPTFKTVSSEEFAEMLSQEKSAMIKNEKDAAIGMVKMASFDGRFQDPYPSPFLNLSDTHIPKTTTEIFKWCKYYYMFDPLIAGAVNALATFPVTEVYLEDKNAKEGDDESDLLKTYKRVLFKQLHIYKLLIEIGIDYQLYGNCFVFGEMWTNPVTKEIEWKHMVRLDPSKMIIDYNPTTQEKKYKWQVPARIAEIVKKKKPVDEYNKIPSMIKEAVRKNQAIVLNSNNIYHFSRATDSMGDNNVWGTPVIANVLKLLMYRNILRQAQEAIAREHIVPMRVYYLQRTQDYNPNADWNAVAGSFAQELNKAVRDPNYKVVSPVPIGLTNVGGEGKSLLLAPEIEQVQAEILAGMNVPREFIFGGVSYSGSSISLKILENQFITYRLLLKDFMQNFVIKNMAKARKEWISEDDDDSLVSVKLQDLKMQDDVQQKQLIIQLNGAGKCTNDYMWKTVGIDPEKMRASLETEALAAVDLDKKVQLAKVAADFEVQKLQLQAQMQLQVFQAQLQKQMQEQYPEVFAMQQQMAMGGDPNAGAVAGQPQATPQAPQGPSMQPQAEAQAQPPQKAEQQPKGNSAASNIDMEAEIQKVALQLIKLDPKSREQFLATLPDNYRQKVVQEVQHLESAKQGASKTEVDMRPLPTQKPPRRDSLK